MTSSAQDGDARTRGGVETSRPSLILPKSLTLTLEQEDYRLSLIRASCSEMRRTSRCGWKPSGPTSCRGALQEETAHRRRQGNLLPALRGPLVAGNPARHLRPLKSGDVAPTSRSSGEEHKSGICSAGWGFITTPRARLKAS